MLSIKEGYKFEYLGDLAQPVLYKTLERTIYSLFLAYTMKFFPLLNGSFSSGKSTCLMEAARMIAQNLTVRNMTCLSEASTIEMVRHVSSCTCV